MRLQQQTSPSPFSAPTVFAEYCLHLSSLLQIAIKIIQKDRATKEFLEKFLPREMRALQRLQHPSILSLYRLVETPRQVGFFIVITSRERSAITNRVCSSPVIFGILLATSYIHERMKNCAYMYLLRCTSCWRWHTMAIS